MCCADYQRLHSFIFYWFCIGWFGVFFAAPHTLDSCDALNSHCCCKFISPPRSHAFDIFAFWVFFLLRFRLISANIPFDNAYGKVQHSIFTIQKCNAFTLMHVCVPLYLCHRVAFECALCHMHFSLILVAFFLCYSAFLLCCCCCCVDCTFGDYVYGVRVEFSMAFSTSRMVLNRRKQYIFKVNQCNRLTPGNNMARTHRRTNI